MPRSKTFKTHSRELYGRNDIEMSSSNQTQPSAPKCSKLAKQISLITLVIVISCGIYLGIGIPGSIDGVFFHPNRVCFFVTQGHECQLRQPKMDFIFQLNLDNEGSLINATFTKPILDCKRSCCDYEFIPGDKYICAIEPSINSSKILEIYDSTYDTPLYMFQLVWWFMTTIFMVLTILVIVSFFVRL